MKKLEFLAMVFVILAWAHARAAPNAVEEEMQVVVGVSCNRGTDSRRLEVQPRDAGCTLQYSKFGKNSEIAAAKHGVEVCKDHLARVRRRLEGSGFQCQ